MPEWKIDVTEETWKELRDSIANGPLLEDGNYLLLEHTVDNLNGLKIEIFSTEHPPPHFRVKLAGESNCFRIDNGEPLYPNGDLKCYFRNIRKWQKKNKDLLIKTWNTTRPSDCPVGEIAIQSDG